MTVVKYGQQGISHHLPPSLIYKISTVLSYFTPEHYSCRGNAKILLCISPFKTIFKLVGQTEHSILHFFVDCDCPQGRTAVAAKPAIKSC